ncbi:MAG: helix-turn-helix domain-containing protein [Candidatus Saccharibacteria bacterium]|nr:helix-turn-helix domain-containing protein [Candidatus Saccharibacteria bacterium]
MKYEENEQDKYLTLTEVSRLLNIHPNTLRNWDTNGTLKATRIGVKKVRRYLKSDIDKFIENSNK